MSTLPRFMFALLLTSAAVSSAQAATFLFGAPLTGGQESPPADTDGSGIVRVTFDDDDRTMRIQASFTDLTAPTTASHIHVLGPPPATTGGVVTQTPSFPGFPLGVTSGVFDQTYDLSLATSYNASFLNNAANMGLTANAQASLLAALQGGRAYFNIHTTAFPGGELRGNLAAIPEPATWALMIGGFGLVGSAIRRRREVAAIA